MAFGLLDPMELNTFPMVTQWFGREIFGNPLLNYHTSVFIGILFDIIQFPMKYGTMEYGTAYFYCQPMVIYFLIPWAFKWLQSSGVFSPPVAWAYSLKGAKNIRFTTDSGATKHCVGEKSNLQGFKPFNASLKVADGRILQVTHSPLQVLAMSNLVQMDK